MHEKSFSDIQTKTWFDRVLPDWVYPYARLARWDRLVGVWLLFLPCLWGMFLVAPNETSIFEFIKLSVLFLIGAIVMRGAGCTINDLWDRDLDKQVERTQNRPLASGALSKKQALIFLVVQALVGAVILFQLNGTTIFIGLLSLPLIIFYPLMKRLTWWPQIFLGITFNWGILMGASAVSGGISLSVIWLYIAGVFWTIAYDTIYAFQDIDDDAMVGIKSTARLFGDKTKPILSGLYGVMGFCLIKALPNSIILNSGVLVIIAVHLIHLWRFWDMTNQSSSLIAFKRHIIFGWLIAGLMVCKFLLTV